MNGYFYSPLARQLERFVAYRRTQGFSYQRAAATLRSFDRYVCEQLGGRQGLPLPDLLRGWLSRQGQRKPVTVAMDLGTLRQFFRYRRRFDHGAFVPGRDWAPQAAQSDFVPHIFSTKQIRALIQEAGRLRNDRQARPTIRTLILILYCTGLRFGEAIRLELRDVDLAQRLLLIRESKGRTRWVPFRADLARELRRYRHHRDRLAPVTPAARFLVRSDGKAFSVRGASAIVRGMLRRLGFKPLQGRIGPRPYDFRHTFAVHRLLSWHHAGLQTYGRLPWLSAYMGHDDILGTEAYLHATPELLGLASNRLWKQLRKAGELR